MKLRLASAERRQSIIDAAVLLFARKGFSGTTTRQIAEAEGVSEALVFKYFASKTALYEAIFDDCGEVNPALQHMQQLPPCTRTLVEIVETVFVHFTRLDQWTERDQAHHRLFLHSLLEDGEFARAGLRTFADCLMPVLEPAYEAARAAGDLSPQAPSAQAAFWIMAQAPLMLGSLALTGAENSMGGITRLEMLRGILRGIGLRDDAIATHVEPGRIETPPQALAATG
jgi:AcrR family transcriptional regulator